MDLEVEFEDGGSVESAAQHTCIVRAVEDVRQKAKKAWPD
jgi:hypothetical protein